MTREQTIIARIKPWIRLFDIYRRHVNGESYEKIGKDHGISRTRAMQLFHTARKIEEDPQSWTAISARGYYKDKLMGFGHKALARRRSWRDSHMEEPNDNWPWPVRKMAQ